MEEIWKQVPEFENYEVSNQGRVRKKECVIIYSNGAVCRHKERLLNPDNLNYNGKGYDKRVTLSKNNKQKRIFVHRLVCFMFIENKHNKKFVNHKDGNPSNNNVDNLEWCTSSENERHYYDVVGKINHNRKFNQSAINDILQNAVKGKNNHNRGNVRFFMEKYSVDRTTILNVINGKYYV